MKDGKVVWRYSNGNIYIIRKYIDSSKCEPHDVKRITEHSDTAMLLTAEPGMGKSTLLSYVEREIKKCNPATWLVRINLSENTKTLQDTEFETNSLRSARSSYGTLLIHPNKMLWNLCTVEQFLHITVVR
jgi:hypothetical protein